MMARGLLQRGRPGEIDWKDKSKQVGSLHGGCPLSTLEIVKNRSLAGGISLSSGQEQKKDQHTLSIVNLECNLKNADLRHLVRHLLRCEFFLVGTFAACFCA